MLILHAQEAGNIPDAADRKNLAEFLARGGGLVTIHAGIVSRDPDWFRTIAGSSWRNGTTKWLEGPMHLYFTDRESPITKDMSNWAMDDEIYYDMDLMPEVAGARRGLHAEGRRRAQRRRAAAGRRAHRRRQAGQRLRHPAADLDLRAHDRRRHGRRIAASSRSPVTSTRTSTGPTTARCCCAASRGRASGRTSTSS